MQVWHADFGDVLRSRVWSREVVVQREASRVVMAGDERQLDIVSQLEWIRQAEKGSLRLDICAVVIAEVGERKSTGEEYGERYRGSGVKMECERLGSVSNY